MVTVRKPLAPWAALVALILLLAAGSAAAQTDAPNRLRVHPDLLRTLSSEGEAADFVRVLVTWRQDPNALAQVAAADKLLQRQAVAAALQADAARTASALRTTLNLAAAQGQARNIRSFWISPVIALEAQPELIMALAEHPDVVQIRPDARIPLADTPFAETSAPDNALPWHLTMIHVDLAQRALGLDGRGVVVANLDTGVDWQHPTLMRSYRGYMGRLPAIHYGNWHVSTNEGYLYPGDGYGHGTHTMGTIVGDDGEGHRVGVAPGARWIAVKIFDNSGFTYESWIHDAFEWIIAPEGDPALAPDVVNCSWGSDLGSDGRFRPDVQALRAAGILPIFSAGNNGPFAGTIGSPASFPEAFAVGAVDAEKLVARFSSRGPGPWKVIRPQIVAPGVDIVSAFPGGGYRSASGTSMAAPHVAGVTALLLQADPTLSPDELEALLTGSAEPLGALFPNQVTGWGLVNAYTAGMQTTESGEIIGRVVQSGGAGVANATLTALGRDGEPPVVMGGEADGAFSLALRPGRYDVRAQAFSFTPSTVPSIEVAPGTRTFVTLTLRPAPTGAVFGRITEQGTGAALAAEITAVGTPAKTQSDPATGLYSLALPPGAYTLTVTAPGHRVGRNAVALAASDSRPWDVALPAAPNILVVDSGRWYYESQVAYFADALDALDYTFDLWTIRDPYGINTGVDDRPTASDLNRYDMIIWSAPSDAPGLLDLGPALFNFVGSGRRLLVSGEDIAFWDGGGSAFTSSSPYLTDLLSVRFSDEGLLGSLTGVTGTVFEGISLTLNTADSAAQQVFPDSAKIANPFRSIPALVWPGQEIGGVAAGICRPYRAGWLGFGLEGAGPRAARVETLSRFFDWFAAPPAAHQLIVVGEDAPHIGLPGAVVTQAVTLHSTGVEPDRVTFSIEGGPWPLRLTLPDGSDLIGGGTYTVTGCSRVEATAHVTIPAGAPRDATATHVLRFASQGGPGASTAITLTTKTPAPVLLVDDERWFHYEKRYTETLDALNIGYDRLVTGGSALKHSTTILPRYPLVLWWTGYDWYEPLAAADMASLETYLDDGGRLLISSQDLLDVNSSAPFVAERLGVRATRYSITATEIAGIVGGPLGAGLGPWPLEYSFPNWSDGLWPSREAQAAVHDEKLATTGVTRAAGVWRTAFFAFPVETLDADARRALLGRTLLWLSLFGESRLEAPAAAAAGSRIPITLTLGLADAAPRGGLRATLPLPPEMALAPGSIQGPWAYDPAGHALVWAGSLAPGAPVTLRADVQLAAEIPAGMILSLTARLDTGMGLILPAEARVEVGAPWLTLALAEASREARAGDSLDFKLVAANIGALGTTARLTETLPAGLAAVPGSAWASAGTITSTAELLTWSGALAPGGSAEIQFRAAVSPTLPGGRLVTRADLVDARGRLTSAWGEVHIPARVYLPVLWRKN